MSNIFDYLDWRGDLTLNAAPFNEVDNLILAELSFLNFAGIVPASGEGGSILHKNAEKVLREEFPELAKKITIHLPDESSRRVGQSIAAASLPYIGK